MTIKEYALLAKEDIEAGYHDNVEEWARANYDMTKAGWLIEEITKRYGNMAERR